MYDNDAHAEVRRLQAMTPTVSYRPRRDRGLPLWVPWLVFVSVVAIGVGFGLVAHSLLVDPPPQLPTKPIAAAAPAAAPSATSSPSAPATDGPVAAARKVKPLEDIEPGDRVLYQGHVCRWQQWDGSIATSTIQCQGEDPFEIQTGRLTPVERLGKPEGREPSPAPAQPAHSRP